MKPKTIAFVDAQNLHLGTRTDGWTVDFKKLRVYLKDNYKTEQVYFFLGSVMNAYTDMYTKMQLAGNILIFREHQESAISEKKGNVDTDIVFEMMRQYAEEDADMQFILISGDGDYFRTVRHLIEKGRFRKILFPNRKFASSLYRQLGSEYYDNLVSNRSHIERKR